MKTELEKLCTDYIASRDAVKNAFRWDNDVLYSVCANIFCACGQTADTERLKECRKVIKRHTRPFSKFRGKKVRSILASMLALGENPEDRMARANDYYRLLRHRFRGTEYLVLAAFLLTDLADRPLTEEEAARGRELFRRMNRQHRMLTNNTDSVFAMLMAFSAKSDDELAADTEAGYRALKESFAGGSGAQTAAQILSITAGGTEEKVQRVIALHKALLEAEVEYGKKDEVAPLAALSLADVPVDVLAAEISEADAFLKTQKGYEKKKTSAEERAVHAVMIVSDQYAGTKEVNCAVMTNTVDLLFAKQAARRLSFALNAVKFGAELLAGSKSDRKEEKAEEAPAETAETPETEKKDEK